MADPAEIEAIVRRVVTRTLGGHSAAEGPAGKSLLDEEMVRQIAPGATHIVPAGTLITPLARQVALERAIKLVEGQTTAAEQPLTTASAEKVVAFGADHGGYALKEQLKKWVADSGYQLIDCGAHSTAAVDYPDFAYAVARLVADGRAQWGIVIDGAGIGSCMAANKVPGIRAAMCYDQATAVNSREHNNANVLTLGAGLIGPQLARQIVQTWLATDFAGGRHSRRVDKIDAIGKRFA
jgi:ribose 5-phosphate isomerase B